MDGLTSDRNARDQQELADMAFVHSIYPDADSFAVSRPDTLAVRDSEPDSFPAG